MDLGRKRLCPNREIITAFVVGHGKGEARRNASRQTVRSRRLETKERVVLENRFIICGRQVLQIVTSDVKVGEPL
jgi:hypothetical protein